MGPRGLLTLARAFFLIAVCAASHRPARVEGQVALSDSSSTWRFSIERVRQFVPENASVRVVEDSLRVKGAFSTGCGTERVSGAVDRGMGPSDLAYVAFTVSAHMPDSKVCLMMVKSYEYEFSLLLPALGRYEVHVNHAGSVTLGTDPVRILTDTLGTAGR